jgi:glycosyltransferase involved in cell wall biosynthesis
MRILFVSQEMPPETGWGGIGTYVDVLSEALAGKGVPVDVLSAVHEQPASRVRIGGVTVYRCALPPVHRPAVHAPESWRRLLLAVSVARLIDWLGLEPDVVECPEWMAEGLWLGLRGQLPLVVRLHSTARQIFQFSGQGGALHGLDGRIAKGLEETSARRANVVISTRANLDEVKGWMRLDESALHAIPYPVRLPQASPMPTDGPPQVTFVGRFEPRKAPEVVLRAAPKVLEAVPDARFTFVGRDMVDVGAMPSTQWMRQEADRLGVAHAVSFTGQLDRDGVDDQLRRSTVCAFPSKWESFGNVVAEASAVGRPVVVSDIGAFRELVQDGATGRVVASDDVDAWVAALVELLGDRERARSMGEAGSKHIVGLSDPVRVAEKTLAAHEHAIDRFRRSQRAGRRRISWRDASRSRRDPDEESPGHA